MTRARAGIRVLRETVWLWQTLAVAVVVMVGAVAIAAVASAGIVVGVLFGLLDATWG